MMQLSLSCSTQHSEPPQVGVGKMKPRRQRRKARGEGVSSGLKKRLLTAEQARMLELNFSSEHKLETARKERLAAALGLDPRQVAVWFQNRRVKRKGKQLEEEYTRLKKMHDSMVAEKCMLEEEVLKLRGQLSAAQEEISKISECYNLVLQDERSCILRSSLSTYATDNLFGDFGDDFLHTPEYTRCNIYGRMDG